MPEDQRTHAELSSALKDVQALLTAHTGELHSVADDIVEDHLYSGDRGLALVTLLTCEAGHYLRLYADARGMSVEEVLQERGRELTEL